MDERTHTGLRAVKIAMAVNTFLAVLKVLLGFIANSIALIGDGLDTTIDVVKNVIVYKGTQIASRPPDFDHPYGHGRAETISSSIIGVSVALAGAFVMYEAIIRFGKTEALDTLMMIGASISIAGKIFLSAYMNIVGKRISNQALIANAKDYFGDILSSISVLLGAILIRFTGKSYFDSIASFFVAIIIIYMGFDILKPAISEIMEETDESVAKEVENIISSFESVCNPHQIRVRKLGSYYVVDLHLEFPEDMCVGEAHSIATEIEDTIKKSIKGITEVIIHIEPCNKN
ncbi:cation diffusion facilitator family transporter [Caldisericum exile]|uniref:Cation efflux protein n=1 Tax=Caldisericum exile (strain DSM 21853 / NBRC 104410 / AZM16c01) TaxID=511051 RepID=A0A7U6JDY1_CALEA|nr:cation diffusion facilitator family transporter [Caldisericum exile]BAL80151.1 putative cation efflux protein [Caldisericum exile AZM16c01]